MPAPTMAENALQIQIDLHRAACSMHGELLCLSRGHYVCLHVFICGFQQGHTTTARQPRCHFHFCLVHREASSMATQRLPVIRG